MFSKRLFSIIAIPLLAGLLNACSGAGEASNNPHSNADAPNTVDLVAPSKPENLHTTTLLPTAVQLSWNSSIDNIEVAGYRVYKNNVLLTQTTATSYLDNAVVANTSYQYQVVAYDTSDNDMMSDPLVIVTPTVADTSAPTAPGSLRTSSAPTINSISLAWNASTDNVAVTGYRVYRGTTLLTTTTSLAYTNNSGLTANTFYQYRVDAFDAAGNSTSSNILNVSTAADTTAPSAPGNLRSTATTSSSISLAWNASTDNVGIAYYRVFRNGTQISQTTNLSYADNTVAASTSYSYTVRAYDAAGNNTISSTLAVTTPGSAATANASLSWTPPTQNTDDSALTNLSGYVVYYGSSPTTLSNTVQVSSGLTSIVIENLQSGSTYYFAISAVNSLGVESDYSNIVSKTAI